MSGMKKVGGIFSIVGAIFLFVMVYIRASSVFGSFPLLDKLSWFTFLATAILALLGGILGFLNKRLGGILVLIGISMAVVVGFIIDYGEIICIYSLVVYIYNSMGVSLVFCAIISIDAIIALIGGILIVAGGAD
jgi:hypothetical protein